ncbi:hypothetical protein RUND412_006416 [Rhizina undulata]
MVDYNSRPVEGSFERVNPVMEHVGSGPDKNISGGGNGSGALNSQAADFLFKDDDKDTGNTNKREGVEKRTPQELYIQKNNDAGTSHAVNVRCYKELMEATSPEVRPSFTWRKVPRLRMGHALPETPAAGHTTISLLAPAGWPDPMAA